MADKVTDIIIIGGGTADIGTTGNTGTTGGTPQADITGPSQLGSAALSIYNMYRNVNPGTMANVAKIFADRITSAYNSGQITEAEAGWLLTLLGV